MQGKAEQPKRMQQIRKAYMKLRRDAPNEHLRRKIENKQVEVAFGKSPLHFKGMSACT